MTNEDKKAIIKSELYGFFKKVGDVVYCDTNNELKTCSYAMYNSKMGTAVGVIVIPNNFLPDGKARMVSLKQTYTSTVWSEDFTDTSLTNYTQVPITDNTEFTSSTNNSYGYLPFDKFTGTTSLVNSTMKYYSTNITYMIPCPYLNDGSMNPEYMKEINGNNALSDFNGKSNTESLVNNSNSSSAATLAKSYSFDDIEIDWYLPACGELGIMATKIGQINTIISNLSGVTVPLGYLWSSSECGEGGAACVGTSGGSVGGYNKNNSLVVRSFALV